MKLKEFLDLENQTQFELQPLPYEYDALEPNIDKETMVEHHTKHQQKYVDNLNKALEEKPYIRKDLMGIFSNIRVYSDEIRNNAGGVWNHQFFWPLLTKKKTKPNGTLNDAIIKQFDSIESFKEQFKEAGLSQFGSGWVWLVKTGGGLKIVTTPNQDNPIMTLQGKPVIGCDVWEHAYYLKHKSNRGKWIDTFFKVLNWDEANKNYNN
jgi:Fe-Mn family superoxide dismutase